MFIGLYLCVPFLNIVVEKVFNSGNRKLIYGFFLVLIFMTSLPPLVDRGEYRIIPNYWQMCFPVLLYFTGAYIRYFQPVIKPKVWAILTIGLIYLQYPIINYLKISLIGGWDTEFIGAILCISWICSYDTLVCFVVQGKNQLSYFL